MSAGVLAERAAAAEAHAVALARPMLGCAMAGEPRIVDLGTKDPLLSRRACQYATALLRRREPALGEDLSHLFASFEPPATVVFRTMVKRVGGRRGEALLIAGAPPCPVDLVDAFTLVLPAHVMSCRPRRRLSPAPRTRRSPR